MLKTQVALRQVVPIGLVQLIELGHWHVEIGVFHRWVPQAWPIIKVECVCMMPP